MAEVNIVLFNVDSSDEKEIDKKTGVVKKPVTADERKTCMKHVLKAVKTKYPKQPSTQLFVLCQDNVNGPKRELICEALGGSCERIPLNEEATVFYRPEQQGYRVTYYKDIDDLQKNYAKIFIPAGFAFDVLDLARLMACVLTPYKRCLARSKILLVSWHGNASRTADDTTRSVIFGILVQLLERLRMTLSCEIVIVGGDFNWEAKKAREKLESIRRIPSPVGPRTTKGGRNVDKKPDVPVNGKVLTGYIPTPEREGLKMIDYIVYWPWGRCENGKTSVLCPDYKREKPRPFDHNIIGYTLRVNQRRQEHNPT